MLELEEIRAYDNGGETFDRYTVFFDYGDECYALGIGHTGNVPNGFCMHVEAMEGDHLGAVVEVEDLPDAVQRAIQGELRLGDYIQGMMS